MAEERLVKGAFDLRQSTLSFVESESSIYVKTNDGSERELTTAGSTENSISRLTEIGHESSLTKIAKEDIKQRRMTVINTFRVGSTTPSSRPSTASSGYKRKTPIPPLVEKIVLERANELHRMACNALDREEYQDAISCLTKAIVLDPDSCQYYIERGEAFFQISDFQSAIINYRRACILQPECDRYYGRLAFIHYLQGQTLFDEENYEDSLECFTRAIELQPDFLGFHTRSIACLAALQRHGECLALVNKRLEIERDNADLYIMRARIHDTFRNDSLCYFDVIDALKLDPNHEEGKKILQTIKKRSEGYKSQAMRFDLMGKADDSISKISSAIDVDPSIPEFHVYRSALLRRNGEFVAALDDLLVAMDKAKHDENHPVYKEAQRQLLLTYNDFAVDCFSKGFYEEAIILLNKAIKSEKSEKLLYINRGDCFYRAKYVHFALSDYLQALELEKMGDSVKYRLAVVYNDLGILEYQERRYEQSEEFFSVAISYNPKVASFYVSRARSRYMLENQEGARIDVISALHLDNNNKDVVSLFTRLFPGKTTTEVLKTEMGEMVEMVLKEVFSEIINDNHGDEKDTHQSFSTKKVLPEIRRRSKYNSDVGITSCMSEEEIIVNVIKGKKKVNELVETVMQSRQSLLHTGPQLKGQEILAIELPSWVDKSKSLQIKKNQVGSATRQDLDSCSNADSNKKKNKSSYLTFLKT